MIDDIVYKRSRGKKIIEALVTDGKVGTFIPVIAMNIWSIGSDGIPMQIKEIRVRSLVADKKKEKKKNV
jgi:hypothetical protein